jgi:Putative beta-barrel porin-2, OmpL-like. bbp2
MWRPGGRSGSGDLGDKVQQLHFANLGRIRVIRKLLLLAAVSGQALAESHPKAPAQDPSEIAPNEFAQTASRGLKLSGYVDTGYSYNFTGGGGGTSDVSGRFGSDTAAGGDFNLYAVKLTLEKALTEENRAQAGFRADVMIGEDASFLANRNAVANTRNYEQNSNALFLEQGYLSLRAPVGNGWDFHVGKFVSILGYEVIERPANMNITYGLLWEQMPLYYTGILSSYKFDDYLDGKLGVVNGSNTDNNITTGLGGDGCAVLASLNVTAPGGNATWSHNFQYSSNAESQSSFEPTLNTTPVAALDGNLSGNPYTLIYNSWGSWEPRFAQDRLLLAFNTLLLTAGGTAGNIYGTDSSETTSWGFGAYAKFQVNDWFHWANRGEFHGETFKGRSINVWEYTATAGFQVIENLLIRAEYRIDWGGDAVNNYTTSGTSTGAAKAGSANYSTGPAHYAGAEVVYSF